ncbi:hypothetical protein BDN72DRAFT_170539 [Pluteus cervinus]|uniref:Uncharacterized protein n=1 Tax=Pluteus cervinus TaxID=181527 RepID=A0ACD3AKC3_9AGAR|nr:hypothetical protein BDN72DRAFT_170539 [Pluteus cervinus]
MFTSLVQTLVGIGSAWLFVYLTEYLWRTFHRREVLPTFHPRTSSSTTVALQKLELTIRTTACNGIYAHVVGMLGRKRRLHRSLQIFYEAGSVIGICGSSLVLLLLLFSCGQSILSLVRLPPNPSLKRPTLGKREIPQEQVIQPIIPGLTVPASDIPLIVIVVLFSQIVHELGHALAGALDQLPISEIGLSLTVIIPSAFVGSPVSSFDALPVKARRRIVSAGPFHNLVFWVCLLLLDQAAFVYPLLGYQDLSEIGLVVVSVNPSSSTGHIDNPVR